MAAPLWPCLDNCVRTGIRLRYESGDLRPVVVVCAWSRTLFRWQPTYSVIVVELVCSATWLMAVPLLHFHNGDSMWPGCWRGENKSEWILFVVLEAKAKASSTHVVALIQTNRPTNQHSTKPKCEASDGLPLWVNTDEKSLINHQGTELNRSAVMSPDNLLVSRCKSRDWRSLDEIIN